MTTRSDALPVLETPQVPSWRLLVTLGGAGALAGLLIVLAYGWTLPRIEAHRAAVLRGAIEEVLHAPARADTLFLENGVLVASPGGARDSWSGSISATTPRGVPLATPSRPRSRGSRTRSR